MAVTKGFGADAVRAALGLGLTVVGENYAQELLAKAADLAADPVPGAVPVWHFLGRLQRNKVRHLAPLVGGVGERRPGRAGRRDRQAGPGRRVLVQANLSGEAQKGGAPLDEVPDLVARARAARPGGRGPDGRRARPATPRLPAPGSGRSSPSPTASTFPSGRSA